MEDPIASKLAEAKRAADELVDVVLPLIRMAVTDESNSHLSGPVERLRSAAKKAVEYYEQRGEPIPAHVLAALRNPNSKPSEQNNRVELGPGAVRLHDVDHREVVRCRSCDFVQFRTPRDECTRCGFFFEDEPAQSAAEFAIDSSGISNLLASGLNYQETFVNVSPELLEVVSTIPDQERPSVLAEWYRDRKTR